MYGGSYKLTLPGLETQAAFLHKSHLPGADSGAAEDKSDSEEEAKDDKKKKAKKVIDELKLN